MFKEENTVVISPQLWKISYEPVLKATSIELTVLEK